MQQFQLLSTNQIYTCTVADIKTVTEPELEVENIYGDHFNGSKSENVHAVLFDSKTVNFFPRKLESFFAFLSLLSVTSSNLTLIQQSDLTPFSNLRLLDLHNNSIQFLPRDLFVYNPNLEVLNLSLNGIKNIDPDIFDYLNFLRFLNLESNDCISDMEVDRKGVTILIMEVKEKCNNCKFEEQERLQKSLEVTKDQCKSQAEEFLAEIESLREQNSDITRRAQLLNANLSIEIEKIMMKVKKLRASAERRIYLLTVMLIAMCMLLVFFTGIIIYLIVNMRSNRDKLEIVEEAVEYERNQQELTVMRRSQVKKKDENLYEDLHRSGHVVESGEFWW